MNRRLRVDRRYPLGQFRYITLEDEITDIPEDLVFNVGYVSKVRFLQIVGIELAYRKYKMLIEKAGYDLPLEEAIEALEELQHKELATLKEFTNGKPLDNGEPQNEEKD